MAGYPNTLIYFMWGWQVHFRIGCQTTAEAVFNSLDPDLQPFVFLVGFNLNPQSKFMPVCVEPETIEYPIKEFANLQELADEIYETHEDRNMLYSGPGMQEEMNGRLNNEVFRLALERRLDQSQYKDGTKSFVASSVTVGDFAVYIVLQLNKVIYESYRYLERSETDRRVRLLRSLLDGCIKEYLDDKKRCLQLPEPGKLLSDGSRTADEILYAGAAHFFLTVSFNGGNFSGLHPLFEYCNRLSQARYENAENFGQLIVARANHPDIEMTLELNVPFEIREYRKTRKMLELSTNDVAVICDSHKILGLGKVKPSYKPATESIFNIYFKGVHCWDVFHAGINILQMRYGEPGFSTETINKESFFSDTRRQFPRITTSMLENLYRLSMAATKQKKGAMLVITDKAQEETNRFGKRCIGIKPIKLNEELLLNLTSIDGGVLTDPEGIAYAKGVILDGVVGANGDAGRGSRYNSAVTYCEYRHKDQSTIVVVVSSDGTVDIVPKLNPQIRHSEITNLIDFLASLNSKENFNRSGFYKAMELLIRYQFYLNDAECAAINALKKDLELLDKEFADSSLWRVFDDVFPNPEMNESYYLKES